MRFINLKVQNIASLRGSHEVDFDEIEQTSSLFAITGQTGSGKSTLLNAISLALFGKTYKQNYNGQDIVTLGEREANIELIYSNHTGKYKAVWNCRVAKKDGTPLKMPKSDRKFYTFQDNDYILQDYTAEQELPLDFEQFCKTVILNQGQFAEFISSTFSKRKDILEKLYQGERLSLLSTVITKKIKTISEQKTNIEHQIEGISAISAETYLEYQQKSKDLNIKTEQLSKQTNKTSKITENVKSIYSLFESKNKSLDRIKEIDLDLKIKTDQHNKLKDNLANLQHNFLTSKKDLDKRKPELMELIKQAQQLKNIETDKSQLISSINKDKKIIDQTLIEIDKNLENIKKSKDKLEFLEGEQYFKYINEQNKETLKAVFTRFKLDSDGLISTKKELQSTLELVEELNKKKIRLEDNNKQLLQGIEQITASSSLDEAEDILTSSKKKLSDDLHLFSTEFTKLNFTIKELDKLENELTQNFNHQTKLEREIEKTPSSLKLHQEKLDSLKENKSQFEVNITKKKLAQVSINQNKCALCDQNFSKDNAIYTIAALKIDENIDNLIAFQQEEINQLSAKASALKLELSKLKQNYQNSKKQYEDTLYQLNLLNITQLCENRDFTQKENLNQLKGNTENKISKIRSALDDLEINMKNFLTQKNRISFNQSQLKENERELELQNKKCDQFQMTQQNYMGQVEQQKAMIAQYNEKILEESNPYQTFNKDWDTYHQYRQELSTLERWQDIDKRLNQRLDELKEGIKNQETQLERKHTEFNNLQSNIRSKIGDNSPSRVLENIEKEHERKQLELDKIQKENNQFESNIKELQARRYSLQEQCEVAQDAILSYRTQILDLAPDIKELVDFYRLVEKLISAIEDTHTIDMIALNSGLEQCIGLDSQLKQELEDIKKELYTVQNELKHADEQNKRMGKAKNQLDLVLKELERNNNIAELLTKDSFRNYVLGILEKNLLIQTNKELEQLCAGRYHLVQELKDNRIGVEFYVIDQYKDGMLRRISTLSGGETFMVSLAMALGLAELTRGQAQIDSFFVDEGFGTLDQDSLEDVVDVLNSMRNRGKQIGIISHVKSLTDRMPVNIGLNKKQNGSSTISIQYN